MLNLPRHAQQLLLDFTQFGSYRPLGYQGREPKNADVRLISVTNGDMQKAIADKRFRQDLYYRLATVPIVLPPLRERRDDIPVIASRYLSRTNVDSEWELDGTAQDLLCASHLHWAGNVRELEAVLERARNRARADELRDPVIEARHLDLDGEHPLRSSTVPPSMPASEPATGDRIEDRWQHLGEQKQSLDAIEKSIIEDALAASEGIVARAARLLAVPRTGLISRMATLEIDPEKFKKRRG